MSCEKELEKLANDLIEGSSPWFKGGSYYRKVLQAIIRDGGRCVYCGKDLWGVFGLFGCMDHLLPRSVYPGRQARVDNLVQACAECNSIKRDFDPSKKCGGGIVVTETTEITEEVRERLIGCAKKEIDERRKSDYWRNEFEIAKHLLSEAVEKYRKCKDGALTY
jgi:HNH endonuclease